MSIFPNARRAVLMRALPPALLLMTAFLFVVDVSGQRRPGKHPAFSDGFRALKQENWKEVADQMLEALAFWKEDGELTRVYGRWFEPYLPSYYLGLALYELGCYDLSLKQLNSSLLNKQEIKGAKKELEELESLKLKSDRFVRQGIFKSESADCLNWIEKINQLEEGNLQ